MKHKQSMTQIKAYTDLEQSKKLAEILPLESADMSWVSCDDGRQKYYQAENRKIILNYEKKHWIPCWSLAALLCVLKERDDCNALEMFTNKAQLYTITTSYYKDASWKNISIISDNQVDACVSMIEKLHELNLL